MNPHRSPITTHVLDVARGLAASGVGVTLEALSAGAGPDLDGWRELRSTTTDSDGRVEDLLPAGKPTAAGVYRLTFAIGAYFRAQGLESFYPQASVIFEIKNPAEHHHVPLLLSPFGYSTYRGT